jgi:DNA-binding transcriptional LysR family regulator
VARAIRAFSEACPKVSLTLEESLSNDLLNGLRDERMDVAFIRTAPADPKNLAIERLLDEPMVVALSRDHPLARSTRNASIPLKRLASESFILYGPPGTGMYDTIIAACHAAGFNPSVGNLGASTQQGPRIGSTLSLIAAGLGITFVPSSLQRMNIEGVAYRRLRATTPPTTRLSLATRRGDQSPTVKQFITVVRKSAKIPLM